MAVAYVGPPLLLGRLEGNGRRGKALTADYVLVYLNTKLGVIEAGQRLNQPVTKISPRPRLMQES